MIPRRAFIKPPAYSCSSCASCPSISALWPVGVVFESVICHLRMIEVEGCLIGLTQRSAHHPPDENTGRAESHQYGQSIRTQYFVLCHDFTLFDQAGDVRAGRRYGDSSPYACSGPGVCNFGLSSASRSAAEIIVNGSPVIGSVKADS